MRHEGMRRGEARTKEAGIAGTTASDLKTVAEDMLRMGRHWARAAQWWLERAGDQAATASPNHAWSRSDRDLQSDYGGDGYDQVAAGRTGAGAYAYAGGEYGGRDYGGRDYGGRDYRGVGPRNYTRSDERIREDLNERLTEAWDLDASALSVEVEGGVATLSGHVPQRWMKHRAEDLVDACIGVTEVRNQIRVGEASTTQGSGGATASAGTADRSRNAGSTTSTTGTTAGNPTGHAGTPGKETP